MYVSALMLIWLYWFSFVEWKAYLFIKKKESMIYVHFPFYDTKGGKSHAA